MDMFEPVRESAITEVDKIASKFGTQFISADSNYIMHEYDFASRAAEKWLEDTTKPCPLLITAWAKASSLEHIEAAQYIIQKADEFVSVISVIRDLRLSTKVLIRAAETEEEISQALVGMREHLIQLSKYKPV